MKTRLSPEKRVQIQYLHSLQKSDGFIARTVGCKRETVKRWTNRSIGTITEKPRFGQNQRQLTVQNVPLYMKFFIRIHICAN